MQSEALERERHQLALEAARVLPQSTRLLASRRSLSPSRAIQRLSTPKSRASLSQVSPDSSRKQHQAQASESPKRPGVVSERLDRLSQPRTREVGKAVDLTVDVSQIPTIARAQATLDHLGPWPCGIPHRSCTGPVWAPPSPHSSTQQEAAAADELKGTAWPIQTSKSPERAGIGIQLTHKKNDTFVIDCLPAGGPAAMSGKIEVGDELMAVDGVKIGGRDMAFVASRITGPPDTSVKLSLLRRTFTKGSNAERRRQFVVVVKRKVPPGQAYAASKSSSVVPALPLGQQVAGNNSQPGRQRFKSPRNHMPHQLGDHDDTAAVSPPPAHEACFKSPRNHQPLAHLASVPSPHAPSSMAADCHDESDGAQNGARVRLLVDQDQGAPEEWYANQTVRDDESQNKEAEAAASKPARRGATLGAAQAKVEATWLPNALMLAAIRCFRTAACPPACEMQCRDLTSAHRDDPARLPHQAPNMRESTLLRPTTSSGGWGVRTT